jgi:nitrite reductase/ring-hydroxylating ferredoxin subunit
MTDRILIGDAAQIPKGEGRVFAAAGRRIAVFHTHSGEVFATQAECPHLQGPLADGLTGGTTLVCPLHDRAFDLRTGRGLNGESSNLEIFPASLGEDGKIWLSMPTSTATGSSDRIMETFVRVAEIWVPTEDGTRLRLLDGFYGPFDDFRALSEQTQFRYNEGLPGQAWAARHPIILKDLENSNLKRGEAGTAIALTCGVALPVFAGDLLKAVVVLLCGDSKIRTGAIELWHNDPGKFNEMRLVDGYYGAALSFEFNSQHMRFPRGYGLPGRVWKSNMPLIMKDFDSSNIFLRRQEAVAIGINRGLGVPYLHPSGKLWVLTFLSARDTPIARRFEIWIPDQQREFLIFHSGDCDRNTQLADEFRSAGIAKGEGTLGQVWQSGIAAVCRNLADDPSRAGRSAVAARLNAMVAMPVMTGQELRAVVAWYF